MDKKIIARELIAIVRELVFTDDNTDLETNLTKNIKYVFDGEKMNMLGLYNEYSHGKYRDDWHSRFPDWLNKQVEEGRLKRI